MPEQDYSPVIISFSAEGRILSKLAVPYNEHLAIVRTCLDHDWLVVLRKHAIVLIAAPSVDACCYFCNLISLTCTDFNDREKLNAALELAFEPLKDVIFQMRDMDEQRFKMYQNDELIGL